MTINIDQFTEAELVDLNRRIVERLRFMQQARSHVAMLRFRIGEQVCFSTEADGAVFGVIIRYNKKSVTLLADDGRLWRVAPVLLRPVQPGPQASSSPDVPLLLPNGG